MWREGCEGKVVTARRKNELGLFELTSRARRRSRGVCLGEEGGLYLQLRIPFVSVLAGWHSDAYHVLNFLLWRNQICLVSQHDCVIKW